MTGKGSMRLLMAAMILGSAVEVQATSLHFEGFEDPAWTAGLADNWQELNGTIDRVVSGTGGIASSAGVAHAQVGAAQSSVFTRFGGYRNDFGNGFTASLDIYLDPNWDEGTGFDYSVAVSNQSGGHQRDWIFHVGVEGGDLLVNASNNADFVTNPFKLLNDNGGNNFTVTSAGWYTFQHVFADDGTGLLSVDYNLLSAGGTVLYSVTRGSNPADDIATTVGGNRYGWFTHNDIANLAIDNTSLVAAATVPEPTTMSLMALAAGVLASAGGGLRRRKLLESV